MEEALIEGPRRAGESLPEPSVGPCTLPLRLPGRYLPPWLPWPQPAGGVAGRGGGDRHQCPRLPRGAQHCLGGQRGGRFLEAVPGR